VHPILAADLNRASEALRSTLEAAMHGIESLGSRPVVATAPVPPARPVPERGLGLSGALATFTADWEPGMSGNAGPRHLGFVTGGATPASECGVAALSRAPKEMS